MHLSPKSGLKSFRRTSFLSFCITMLVAGATILVVGGPAQAGEFTRAVDTEVAMIFAPLCALLVAIVFEVARVTLDGNPLDSPAPARPLHHWNGERRVR